MYINGLGVKQNYQEGFKWLKEAAEQDDVDAQFKVGMMYKDGVGVKQNNTEAVKWLKKSGKSK